MGLLVVGSIALDSVDTPFGSTADAVGGSAVACVIVGFILYFIIPKFEEIFLDFGVALPGWDPVGPGGEVCGDPPLGAGAELAAGVAGPLQRADQVVHGVVEHGPQPLDDVATPPRPRRPTRPTRAARERRLEEKRRRGVRKRERSGSGMGDEGG